MSTLLKQCERKKMVEYVVPDILDHFDKIYTLSISNIEHPVYNEEEFDRIPWFNTVGEMLNEARNKFCPSINRKLSHDALLNINFKNEAISETQNTPYYMTGIYEEVAAYQNGLSPQYSLECCAAFDKDSTCPPFNGNIRELLDTARESGARIQRRLNDNVVLLIKITDRDTVE